MHKSIATVSMSGTLPEKLKAISVAGFDGIELFEQDFIGFKGSATDLQAMAQDFGLSIDLYQPFRDFEGMPEAQFRKSLDRAERKFDVMQALSTSLMLCCSNTSPLAVDDPPRAAAQLHELAERAGRRGLRVGFEALAWGRYTRRYGQAWDLVKQASHPSLGLILDSFHTLSLGDDPCGIAKIPGDKIFFLQIADAPLLSMDVIQWARHHRNFPGQGELRVEYFFLQALLAGYTGPLSLEIFNDIFRATPNMRTAVDALRSLRYLENRALESLQAFRAADADAARCRQVLQNAALQALPPAPDIGEVSFIEYAVDEAAAESLGNLLHSMGFARAGRHRNKKATLYRKGRAALILNTEPGSFARSRFSSFGTSVCAIGLCVGDPKGAVERATALCSAPFHSPTGPNEAVIPAIVAPGGIVIHFIAAELGQDALFAIDFDLEAPPRPDAASGPAWSVDHIALCLNIERRDTWLLFARSVLGLEPDSREQFAEPYGLTDSLGTSNASRSIRFALIASQSPRAVATRTADAQDGVAVRHVSFSVQDIFAEVFAWRNAGVPFVDVPDNYYDDLATRFELDSGTIERLRRHGVLFDRDSAGDYYHIFTENLDNGFCFEIAQRTGAYSGYGASNPGISLGMQAQAADRNPPALLQRPPAMCLSAATMADASPADELAAT